MATKLTGKFETRRQAEMAVERLVQEFDFNADDIEITAVGPGNSAGTRPGGSDKTDGTTYPKERDDAPTEGSVEVTVQTGNDASAARVLTAFDEFKATHVSES